MKRKPLVSVSSISFISKINHEERYMLYWPLCASLSTPALDAQFQDVQVIKDVKEKLEDSPGAGLFNMQK